MLHLRPRDRGFKPHRLHCVVSLSKTHLSLLCSHLVQPKKTHPDITEKLLTGTQESNQTNKLPPIQPFSVILVTFAGLNQY